jgi:hypothetical protein
LPLVLILLLSGLVYLPGCSVWHLAHRTLYTELRDYPQVTDGKLSCRQYQRWAKDEWRRILNETGGGGFSSDYGSGFLQGFVDQVYAGGNVQTPPMPPRKYWRVGYRNDRGRQAIEDWYAGFRHGARVAREGGYREQSVIPSSLRSDRLRELEPMFVGEPEPASLDEGGLPEPTPAAPIDALEGLEPAPPQPVPHEPVLLDPPNEATNGGSREAATEPPNARMASRTTVSDKRASEVKPSAFEHEAQPTDLPQTPFVAEPDGPPIPPWHKRERAAETSTLESETGSETVLPGSFDPFGGTPFEDTLGLNPANSIAPGRRSPLSAPEHPVVPVKAPVPAETGSGALSRPVSRFTEAADPQNSVWQEPTPPPSTWKSRN